MRRIEIPAPKLKKVENMNFVRTIEATRVDDSRIELSLENDTVDIRYTLYTSKSTLQAILNTDDMTAFYNRSDVSVGHLERGELEPYLVRVAEGLE